MDIDLRYRKVLEDLEKGARGLARYSSEELSALEEALLSAKAPEKQEKILCLLDHAAVPHQGFEAALLRLLNSEAPDRVLVFALTAARKHVLQARFIKGQRLDFEILETLKRLLHHRSPEVVEWTLRTIEECGSQGVYFLREFDKIKPKPWKWFNAHNRAVRELIELLERRWRRFEKPES